MLAYLGQLSRTATSSSSPLRRFLWRFERSQDQQDDIIQQALLEALRCSHHDLRGASVQTWFFGVLANVARHHVARQVRQSERTESLDMWQDGSERSATPDDSTPSPEEVTHFRQLARRLEEATRELPPRLRRTLELVCLDECSYIQAAEQLLVPIGTIRSRVNRARMLLRRQMEFGAQQAWSE